MTYQFSTTSPYVPLEGHELQSLINKISRQVTTLLDIDNHREWEMNHRIRSKITRTVQYIIHHDEECLKCPITTTRHLYLLLRFLLKSHPISHILRMLNADILIVKKIKLHTGEKIKGLYRYFYQDGFLHNISGPAIRPSCPPEDIVKYYGQLDIKWYIHGVEYNEENYHLRISLMKASGEI